MKNWILLSIIASFFLGACKKGFSEQEKEKFIQTSAIFFGEFQQKLQKELLGSLQKDGTVYAIDTCKTASPQIEKELSDKYKIVLKRVSDRPRNPSHLADEWELSTLKEFIQFQQEGKEIPVVTYSDDSVYRVMKPITISNAMCLQCHGSESDISEETLTKLKEAYPSDKAIGYSIGEVRGAFSATWRKN